jgi:hypothetical protein
MHLTGFSNWRRLVPIKHPTIPLDLVSNFISAGSIVAFPSAEKLTLGVVVKLYKTAGIDVEVWEYKSEVEKKPVIRFKKPGEQILVLRNDQLNSSVNFHSDIMMRANEVFQKDLDK